jgi:hypothetical protein
MLPQFLATASGGKHTGDRERVYAGTDKQIGSAGGLIILDNSRRTVMVFTVEPFKP